MSSNTSNTAPTFFSSSLTDKHLLFSVNSHNPAECFLFTGTPVPHDVLGFPSAALAFQPPNNYAPTAANPYNEREPTPYASNPGSEYCASPPQTQDARTERDVFHSPMQYAYSTVDPRKFNHLPTPYVPDSTIKSDPPLVAPGSPVYRPTPSPAPSWPPIDAVHPTLVYPPTPPPSPPRVDTAMSAPATFSANQPPPDDERPPSFKRPDLDRESSPDTAFTGDSLLRTPPGLHPELDTIMEIAQRLAKEAAEKAADEAEHAPSIEPDTERRWERTLGGEMDWRNSIGADVAANFPDWRSRPIGPDDGPFFGTLCPGCRSAQPAPMDRRLQYIEDSLADLGNTLNGLRESAERRMSDIYMAIDRVGEDAAEARYYTDHIYYDHDRGICVMLDRLQHVFTTLHAALDNNLSRIDNTLWHLGSDWI